MATLNKTQLAHATKRLSEQKSAYIKSKLAALGEPPELIEYSDSEKTAMIYDGRATIKKGCSADAVRWSTFGSLFDYPLTPEMVAAQQAHDAWEAAAEAIRCEAKRIMQSVLDELIMSPNGKAALDYIAQAFQ